MKGKMGKQREVRLERERERVVSGKVAGKRRKKRGLGLLGGIYVRVGT